MGDKTSELKILSESSGLSLMGTENVEVEMNLRLFLKISAIGFKILGLKNI